MLFSPPISLKFSHTLLSLMSNPLPRLMNYLSPKSPLFYFFWSSRPHHIVHGYFNNLLTSLLWLFLLLIQPTPPDMLPKCNNNQTIILLINLLMPPYCLVPSGFSIKYNPLSTIIFALFCPLLKQDYCGRRNP